MVKSSNTVWTGFGRWLLIGLGVFLILLSIPSVLSHDNGAAAGWDIFLGLLAISSVASGNPKAPSFALILAALMVLRLILIIVSGPRILDLVGAFVFLLMAAGAAYDLRKQAISAYGRKLS